MDHVNNRPVVAPRKILGADGLEAQKALPEECCGNCYFGKISANVIAQAAISKARECHRFPPKMQHFLLSPPPGSKQPHVVTHSDWGGVPIGEWCGEWQPQKRAGVNKAQTPTGTAAVGHAEGPSDAKP